MTPRNHARRYVAGVALLAATFAGGVALAGDRDELSAREAEHRVVVRGCPAEDACRIDYRARAGRAPVWVIREVRH